MKRTMFDDSINVLFPLETTVREWDYRALMTARIARPGMRIFLGRHAAFLPLLPTLRGGVYLGKNFIEANATQDMRQHKMLQKSDLSVLYHDEEGGVYFGGEEAWKKILDTRIDPTHLGERDRLCAWGDFQRDHYASKLSGRSYPKVSSAGHPRFDMLKEKYRPYFAPKARAISKKYGKFVLVIGSFPLGNNHHGEYHVFSPAIGYDSANPDYHMRRVLGHKRRFTNYIDMVHTAALANPDLHFIIRPHPSENHENYRQIFQGRQNIEINHEGSAVPWIMASEAIIHPGSTIGLEAHLLDAVILNYKADEDPDRDVYLTELFGHSMETAQDVYDALDALRSGGLKPAPVEVPERARKLLHSFEHDGFDALSGFIDAAIDEAPGRYKSPKDAAIAIEGKWIARQKAKALVRPLFPVRQKLFKAYRSRFRPFSEVPFREDLERAGELFDNPLKVTRLSERLLVIETKEQ